MQAVFWWSPAAFMAMAMAAVTALASAGGCSQPSRDGSVAAVALPADKLGVPVPAPADDDDPLVVMTYNVNFGIPGDESTLAALRSGQADLVVVEEVTPAWERALRERTADRYPHMLFRTDSRAGGLAVLSRWKLEDADFMRSPAGWFPGWRVIADTPLGKLQVLALHLRPPLSDRGAPMGGFFTTGKDRRAEIEAYWTMIDPALPVLAAGDFNEARGGGAVQFLEGKGLISALPAVEPDRATWRWDTKAGRITWQLDHVMFDSHFELVGAEVIEAGRSDHLPVVARLRAKAN